MKRRTFLELAGLSGLSVGMGLSLHPRESAARASRPAGLRILVLGGTSFLGPAFVEAARSRGHQLTLFNRGKTNPGLFPEVEQIHGDRKADLARLAGRSWDAVVDTSGYLPGDVEASATALRDHVKHYVFISTISVYGDVKTPNLDETAPTPPLPANADATKVTNETYGPLKALCEQAAEKAMPGRVANVRPGLIVGPRDNSDRFTYWPARMARGGDVLAPGKPTDPVQLIDVRDLAWWLCLVCEARHVGVYNATGPAGVLTVGEMLAACQKVAGVPSRLVWASARFLEEKGISPWMDMPVWVPPESEDGGMTSMSRSRAVAAGLTFRPIVDTARDTLAWWNTLPADRRAKPRAGLSPEREQAALAALAAPTPAPPAAASSATPVK